MMTRPLYLVLLPGLLLIQPAEQARADGPAKEDKAAKVENRVNEADLTRIKLTPKAEQRLGIELSTAERKPMIQFQRLAGQTTVPPGRSIVSAAPVAGLVSLPATVAAPPSAGQRVARGDPLFLLLPGATLDGRTFVPADRISLAKARADLHAARAEVEGSLAEARVRVEAAEVKLKRADQLRQEGAGAERTYDEARAELEMARAAERAARERFETLSNVIASLESSEQAAVTIDSPLDGYIRTVHVAPAQIVSAGAPLVEIDALDPIWIRVPIYVGDLCDIDPNASARVREFGDQCDKSVREARRVPVPGAADPLAATVDLFFELSNPDATLRPGQRVAVELATRTDRESLVIPHAAVLYDIYGGTWVYVLEGPQHYLRSRVTISNVIGDLAIVVRGLDPGKQVVTSGAAELFGTEFGSGK